MNFQAVHSVACHTSALVFAVLALSTVMPFVSGNSLTRVGRQAWYYERIASSNFSFREVFYMLRKKNNLLNTLNAHIEEIRSQQAITQEEKIKMEALKVYERELKATEKSLATVLQDLNQTLSSDYRSLDTLKHSCQMRMGDMHDAAPLV